MDVGKIGLKGMIRNPISQLTLELFEIFQRWRWTVVRQLQSCLTSPVSDPNISPQFSVDEDELCGAPVGRGNIYFVRKRFV